MNKQEVFDIIKKQLEDEAQVLTTAANISMESAISEENKSEDEYDSAGLEASYLATGQTKRLNELQKFIEMFKAMKLKKFGKNDPIGLTALVELESNKQHFYYFIAPESGGLKVDYQKKQIMIITPASPLGRELMGKSVGDSFDVETPNATREYTVKAIH